MAMYRCDTLIKNLRLQSGLTQSQLADGIVTKETISRIERGLHVPTTIIMGRLLERLCVDPQKYVSAIISADDFKLNNMKLEFESLYHAKKFKEAHMLAGAFDKSCGDNRYHRQYVKTMYANLALSDEQDFEKVLKISYDGLRMTFPDFELCKLKYYVFSNTEISFINLIAAVFYMREDYVKAITILKDTIESLERGYLEATEQSKVYLYLTSNLTLYTMQAERYEECYDLCKLGITHSKKLKETLALPNFYTRLGASAFKLGRIEEAKRAVDLARHLYAGLERDRELEDLNNWQLKEIGFDY